MKRIVVLLDGTWNDEATSLQTNIAKLDQHNANVATPLIRARATDGTIQKTFYHVGVGAESDFVRHLLGGAIGLGLKAIVQQAYETVVDNYESGDELYLMGFSRGSYTARALAGLIGASGIQRQRDKQTFEVAWSNYRVRPGVRQAAEAATSHEKTAMDSFRATASRNAFHSEKSVKCVAVFDTVGSYGVPAGFGLAPLARYWALWTLGFHDTAFGDHVDIGLHAVGIDERRRPFVPTFWTCPKGRPPRAHVEQTWFAGVHCNVGGGYQDVGLSYASLIWMIARMQALTGLEFDAAAVRQTTNARNVNGTVYDSTQGWIIDHTFPHFRVVLSPDAIDHRAFMNVRNAKDEHINERVHWTVTRKLGQSCTYYGKPNAPYLPPNLPTDIPAQKIAEITPEEAALWA
jgi:uncharacterized protein (DUF2235 family)